MFSNPRAVGMVLELGQCFIGKKYILPLLGYRYGVREIAQRAIWISLMTCNQMLFQFKFFKKDYHLSKAGKIQNNITDVIQNHKFSFLSTFLIAPSDPPKDVHYANISSSSIILFWTPPSKPNGIIQYYSVYYRNTSGTFVQVRSEFSPSSLYPLVLLMIQIEFGRKKSFILH